MSQSEIRQNGFEKDNFEQAFLWTKLELDFIRQFVEYDVTYKHILQRWLMMAVHGYATFASAYFHNMYLYLKNGMALNKQLKYYADKTYALYKERLNEQMNSEREVYYLLDSNGRVLDKAVI